MPDRRQHRGPHPEDARLFATDRACVLCTATQDLSWLLSRDYAPDSALKLVGDRYQLLQRQRLAVMRCSSADHRRDRRLRHEVAASAVSGQEVVIDGFNLLTTVEAALSGGVLLRGRDGCIRDMASMHGSYRRVEETRPALERIGRTLSERGAAACTWMLDRPVSNSGRLRTMILETAAEHDWDWQAELVDDPDPLLKRESRIVATADAAILDVCERWLNLARLVVDEIEPAWLLDLSPGSAP